MNFNGNPYNPYQYPYGFYPYGNLTPEEYFEKLAIKKFSNSIGAAFLILNSISFVASLVMVLLGSLNDAFLTWVIQILLSTLVFTVPFIVSTKIMGVRVSDIISFKKVQPSMLFPLVLAGLGVSMLGNMAASVISYTMSLFGIHPSYPDFPVPKGVFGGLIYFLGLCVVPALVEEFAMRGVVMGSLRRFGDGFAIFVSAMLFGIMHGNLIQAVFAFILGLILGYMTVASGSIWTAVTLHFLNNFLSLVISEITKGLSAGNNVIISCAYFILFLALGIIGAALYLKKYPAGFRINKSKLFAPTKRAVKYFFSAPLTIITLIIYAITFITNQVAMSFLNNF
ncbi:MAG TPA: CPBP family intramembrane metalloprotease [Clostridiales bacterium]|nr:CPBP family intramembrane metalloprotease [Clostridiales bacterium]